MENDTQLPPVDFDAILADITPRLAEECERYKQENPGRRATYREILDRLIQRMKDEDKPEEI